MTLFDVLVYFKKLNLPKGGDGERERDRERAMQKWYQGKRMYPPNKTTFIADYDENN